MNAETLGNNLACLIRKFDDEHKDMCHPLETDFREKVLKQELPEGDYSFAELNLTEEITELIQNSDSKALRTWIKELNEWELDERYEDDPTRSVYTDEEIHNISCDAGKLLSQLDTVLNA